MPTDTLMHRWQALATGVAPDAVEEYRAAGIEQAVGYRLARERTNRPGYQQLHGPGPQDPHLDLTIVPALTAAVLPPSVERRLFELGPLLRAAIRICARIVPHEPASRRFLTGEEKSEEIGLSASAGTDSIADWMRVDYLLESRGGQPLPRIVDINLMPGMTHTTAAIQELFLRYLLPEDPRLRDQVAALRPYTVTPIDMVREGYARSAGTHRVLFTVRHGHGLEPDVRLAARSLTARGKVHGQVLYAHELAALLKHPPRGRPDVVVRQARTTTKHPDPHRAAAETAAIDELLRLAADNLIHCHPGPHIYMEHHAWPYFFRAVPAYSSALRRELGSAGLRMLHSSLADTGIIDTDRIRWPDGETETLTADTLVDRVIKRGTSTGAEAVTILAGASRGRRKYREQAAHRLLAEPQPGWVVQRYVDAPKQTHMIVTSAGAIEPVTGHMRYGAYYAAGRYMGGYALLSPDSRLVHGGSNTHWIPIMGARR